MAKDDDSEGSVKKTGSGNPKFGSGDSGGDLRSRLTKGGEIFTNPDKFTPGSEGKKRERPMPPSLRKARGAISGLPDPQEAYTTLAQRVIEEMQEGVPLEQIDILEFEKCAPGVKEQLLRQANRYLAFQYSQAKERGDEDARIVDTLFEKLPQIVDVYDEFRGLLEAMNEGIRGRKIVVDDLRDLNIELGKPMEKGKEVVDLTVTVETATQRWNKLDAEVKRIQRHNEEAKTNPKLKPEPLPEHVYLRHKKVAELLKLAPESVIWESKLFGDKMVHTSQFPTWFYELGKIDGRISHKAYVIETFRRMQVPTDEKGKPQWDKVPKERLDGLLDEIPSLRSTIADLEDKIKGYESQTGDLVRNNTNLATLNKSLNQEVETAGARINEESSLRHAAEKERDEAVGKLESEKSELEKTLRAELTGHYEAMLAEMAAYTDTLNSSLRERDEMISRGLKDPEELEKAKKRGYEEAEARYKAQLEGAQQAMRDSAREAGELMAKNSSLEERLDAANKRIRALEDGLEERKAKNLEVLAKATKMMDEYPGKVAAEAENARAAEEEKWKRIQLKLMERARKQHEKETAGLRKQMRQVQERAERRVPDAVKSGIERYRKELAEKAQRGMDDVFVTWDIAGNLAESEKLLALGRFRESWASGNHPCAIPRNMLDDLVGQVEADHHVNFMTRKQAEKERKDSVDLAIGQFEVVIKKGEDKDYTTRESARAEAEKAAIDAETMLLSLIESGNAFPLMHRKHMEPFLELARIRAVSAFMGEIDSGDNAEYMARKQAAADAKSQIDGLIKEIANGHHNLYTTKDHIGRIEAKHVAEKVKLYRQMRESAEAGRRRGRDQVLSEINSGKLFGYHSREKSRRLAALFGKRAAARSVADFRAAIGRLEVPEYAPVELLDKRNAQLEDAMHELAEARDEAEVLELERDSALLSQKGLKAEISQRDAEIARLAAVEEDLPETVAQAVAAERGELVKMIYSGDHLVFTTKYAMDEAARKAKQEAYDAEKARRTAMLDSVANGTHPCIVSRMGYDEAGAWADKFSAELSESNLRAIFSGLRKREHVDKFMASAGMVLMPTGKYRNEDIEKAAGMLASSVSEWEARAKYRLTPKFLDEMAGAKLVVKLDVGGNTRYFVAAPESIAKIAGQRKKISDLEKQAAELRQQMESRAAAEPAEETSNGRGNMGNGEGENTPAAEPEFSVPNGFKFDYSGLSQNAGLPRLVLFEPRPELAPVEPAENFYIDAQHVRHNAKSDADYTEAIRLVQKAVDAGYGKQDMISLEMGFNLLMLKKYDSAEQMFLLALANTGSDAVKKAASHNLHTVYSIKKDNEKAGQFAPLKGKEGGIEMYVIANAANGDGSQKAVAVDAKPASKEGSEAA